MIESPWRIAIVIDPDLAPGALANTIAVIAIGLGAAAPHLGGDQLINAGGRSFRISANRPVPMLQADPAAIGALYAKARPPDGIIVPFPRFAPRPARGCGLHRFGSDPHRRAQAFALNAQLSTPSFRRLRLLAREGSVGAVVVRPGQPG
jgi:Protein of unknown function (DUF2000)